MNDYFCNALSQMHALIGEIDLKGKKALDATAGNGQDTLFLAQAVGDKGKVFAFDIQEIALERTAVLLKSQNITWCQLIHDSHENIDKYGINFLDVITFNLGYLPNGDHHLITKPQSTITAISKALKMLVVNGLLTIIIYNGHPGGQEEETALLHYLSQLPRSYDILEMKFLNRKKFPPYFIAIRKMKEV